MPTLIMTSTFNLGANVVWIPYNLLLLPLLVQNTTTPATKATILGALVGIPTCVAIVANLLAGIISDHTRSRFGRRRPILIGGMLLAIPFLLLPVLFRPTLLIVCLSYLGMQVFTNVSAAAFQPTLADFIPPDQRGITADLKGVFTLAGTTIGGGGTTSHFAANQYVHATILL